LPFLATSQPAVFYPPKILLYGLLPREAAHWAFLAVHYVVAALSMAYLLKTEGVRELGIFVGMIVWVFSIPILLSNYHPIRISSLCWMPLIFAFSSRAAHGSARAVALIALLVAVELLSGYPEFTTDQGVLVGVHAVACWAFRIWKRPLYWTLPLLGGAFALGGLAAAVQLVPLAELAVVSNRDRLVAAGSYDFPASVGPAPFVLTIPGVFGFACVGLFSRRARAVVAGLVTCLIIGNGGWQVLRLVPGFSFIRFPLVWVYLSMFYFAWASAIAADDLFSAEAAPPRHGLRVRALAATSVGFAVFYALGYKALESATPTSLSLSTGTKLAACIGMAGGLAIAATAWISLRRRVPSPVWMAVITIAVIAHFAAFPFGAPTASFRAPSAHGQAARYAHRVRPLTGRALSVDDILYGYEVTDRMPSPLGVEQSFLPWRYRRIVSRLGFISMFGRLDWDAVRSAYGYLDAMDVELVIAPPSYELALGQGGLIPVMSEPAAVYLTNPTHMGHAWVNYAVRRAYTEAEALDHFVGPRFDPHREVIVEQSMRREYESPNPHAEQATLPLREERASDTDASWDVELARPGVFVVSETAFPGWEATVDGRPEPWLRVDYVLRGVELDAGRHRVRFQYRPWSFRWGSALSIAGLVAILALFGWRRTASITPVSSGGAGTTT
jgi:hypothetical protein